MLSTTIIPIPPEIWDDPLGVDLVKFGSAVGVYRIPYLRIRPDPDLTGS